MPQTLQYYSFKSLLNLQNASRQEYKEGALVVILLENRNKQESTSLSIEILSVVYQVATEQIRIHKNEKGKPIALIHSEKSSIEVPFSISHSKACFCLAVAYKQPKINSVGIDLEFENRDKNILPIASYYFNSEETIEIEKTAKNEQNALFYKYWTIKEARAKAIGSGIGKAVLKECIPLNHLGKIQRENISYELMDLEEFRIYSFKDTSINARIAVVSK